jgi:O-antigen/teichoic acid export membrane protein
MWQAGVYIVPLLTTPYTARVLGVEQFGAMAFGLGVVGYITIITEWGFSLSATALVARSARSPEALRLIFWDTLLAKLMLSVVSIALLLAAMLWSPTLRAIWPVLLASSLNLFSSVFGVNWFLQGLEKMGAFAISSLVGRFLSVPLTFALVHGPGDAAMAAAIQGGTGLISAFVSLYVAARVARIGPPRLDLRGAGKTIVEGWHMFLSVGAISLYTQINLLVVGFVSGPAQVGFFSGAERIRRATQGITGPISGALYPRINNAVAYESDKAVPIMLRLLGLQGGLTLVLSIVLYLSAPIITPLFLGKAYVGAIPVVQCLAAVPFLVGLSNALGINMMLPLGMKRTFTYLLMASGVLNVLILFPLTAAHGALGAATSVLITEIVVTAAMAIVLFARRGELSDLARRGALGGPAGEVGDGLTEAAAAK